MLRARIRRLSFVAIVAACGPAAPGSSGGTGGDSSCPEGDLPPAGSACAEEAAVCEGPPPDCGTAPRSVCTDGEWVHTPGEECTPGTTGAGTSEGSTGAPTTGGEVVPCGDVLPPEGSPCATPNEDCAPDADPCAGYTGALCTGGQWTYYEVGAGDPSQCEPSCDPFPTDGQACSIEGASCSTGCQNVCEFCNVVVCEDGVWGNIEVFPLPCLDCQEICAFTVVPMCAGGPPDAAACVAGCQDGMAMCEIAFSEMLGCAGTMPTFSCDEQQRPTIAGCEAEFAALYMCLGV